jgi:hypothetical protein
LAEERTVQDKTSILQRELDELRAQITALERALGEKPDCGLGKGLLRSRAGNLIWNM